MADELVAGVDCSTQGTKVLVVDAATGRVVAEGRAPHVVSGTDGARESDPDGWWTALREALAATGRASSIRAISIAGQQHGLVVLDAHGRALRPAILWNDTRSAADAARLVEELGGGPGSPPESGPGSPPESGPEAWARRIGSVPVASFTVGKWAWLRRTSPDVAAATRAVRLPHDYLTERLTGRGVTDRGDASGTGWWSVPHGRYDEDVLGLAGVRLDPALLPEVLGPGEAAGTARAGAAAALGLSPRVLVGPGTGDNMGAALGLGLEPGEPVMNLGTSGTVYVVSGRAAADPTGTVAGFADATGRFLPLACTLNCTQAVDRIAAWLHLDREAVAPSDGVVLLPYLDGERTPNLPDAAGAVFGLRHTTAPGSILMAAYEGAIVSLLDGLEAIGSQMGRRPAGPGRSGGPGPFATATAPLTLIGGGAQGAAWQSVARRLSGRPVRVVAGQEFVAMGAAVQAAAVLGGEQPAEVARRWRAMRDGTSAPPPPAVPADADTVHRHREARQLSAAALTREGLR
jgi:xylulokinase